MHYFHNFSTASGGFPPDPQQGSTLQDPTGGLSFPDHIICPPIEKNPAGAHAILYGSYRFTVRLPATKWETFVFHNIWITLITYISAADAGGDHVTLTSAIYRRLHQLLPVAGYLYLLMLLLLAAYIFDKQTESQSSFRHIINLVLYFVAVAAWQLLMYISVSVCEGNQRWTRE